MQARIGRWTAALALPAILAATGCQVEMGGQTLPSPYYMTDDVQYYAPGPSFILAKEAAAMMEAKNREKERAPAPDSLRAPAPDVRF